MNDLLDIAKDTCVAAGMAAMAFYDQPDVNKKTDGSPVTNADIAANEVIFRRLSETDIPIRSEETVDSDAVKGAKTLWIIDPIDGTRDFIERGGEFAVMIGLYVDGEVLLGAVYAPALRELFYAQRDKGAWRIVGDSEPQQIFASKARTLPGSRMLTTKRHEQGLEAQLAQKYDMQLLPQGSAGLKMCRVASGEAEVYMHSLNGIKEWDTCAAHVIVEEAGGVVTDMRGDDLRYGKVYPLHEHGGVIAAPMIHDDILHAAQSLRDHGGWKV